MRNIQYSNVADWHAEKAVDAYLKGDQIAYARHIVIADRLWAAAQRAA